MAPFTAPVLPQGAPVRTPTSTLGETFERWLPPVLLLVSWTVGWIASLTWMTGELILWALVPTTLLLGLRIVLERALARTGADSPLLRGLYAGHVALTAGALVLNPMTCIYAFSGYLDSARFLRGARSRAVVVSTALLCAVGQVGGVTALREETWFFLGLAAVNLLIAVGMMHLAEERERVLAAREQALAEILRVQQENARLQEQLMAGARRTGIEEERTRLSREIHDTVAQGLVGVIRQLEAIGEDLEPAARHRVSSAEEAARDCLLEARRAVEALGPHQLDDHDLTSALSGLVARWTRTHRVVATLDADDAPTDGRHGDVLLRIAQEALANTARHAGARSVLVALEGDHEQQRLRVVDDGRGFDVRSTAAGHGLEIMGERLREVGGRLEVVSAPGRGTTIAASVRR